MELDLTDFVANAAPSDYSASAAELGQDAARITWNHAVQDSEQFTFLDTDDKRETFRSYVRGFGAWTEEEIAAWSDVELNALCIQFISGELRERGLFDTWTEYEAASERGQVSGRLFHGADGHTYIYIGD